MSCSTTYRGGYRPLNGLPLDIWSPPLPQISAPNILVIMGSHRGKQHCLGTFSKCVPSAHSCSTLPLTKHQCHLYHWLFWRILGWAFWLLLRRLTGIISPYPTVMAPLRPRGFLCCSILNCTPLMWTPLFQFFLPHTVINQPSWFSAGLRRLVFHPNPHLGVKDIDKLLPDHHIQ